LAYPSQNTPTGLSALPDYKHIQTALRLSCAALAKAPYLFYTTPSIQGKAMPHHPQDKKRAVNRLRRIRGQAEALERAITDGQDCAAVLQQIAAMRGAVNGLMRDVMESHLRDSFSHESCDNPQHQALQQKLDEAVSLVKSYIK